jgi:D-alanyl-D-alanine carboxypeptidase
MPRFDDSVELRSMGLDSFGREAFLAPEAAIAWLAMQTSAGQAGISLRLLSAFRSTLRQEEIITKKLQAGQRLEQILQVNAYPGYSEHHTGCAVDVGSTSCAHFTQQFAATAEFCWLVARAESFGFSLSYPSGNPHGIAFEPWHWCFKKGLPALAARA